MKNLIVCFCIFIIWGCNPKDKIQVPNHVRNINNKGLTAAEGKLCKNMETLEEFDNNNTVSVYYDFSNYSLYSFVTSNPNKANCALSSNYTQNGAQDTWFSITIANSCIANGSLWELKSISRQNNSTNIVLKEFGVDYSNEVSISAGYSVKLNELYNKVGMHFLKCTAKEKNQ